jgi:hypothetical protein
MNLLDKAFFELQLDFADVLAKHFEISFEESLYAYTSIYTRLIGFSDFNPPHADHPKWQTVLKDMPINSAARLDYVYELYLEYEKNKRPTDNGQKLFGCFSYAYIADKDKFALHFTNADPQGNLGRDRVQQRMLDLKELFVSMKNEDHPTALVYVTTWLLGIEAFCRLFAPAFISSQQLRDKGTAQDNGWWGQFLDKEHRLKTDMAAKLRENMKTKRSSIDEYFPLKTMRAEASQQAFYDFYRL